MQLTILSSDGDFVAALVRGAPAPAREPSERDVDARFDIGKPQWVPGATGGWWELAVDLGIIAVPASVVCNLIASWLWSAMKPAPTPREIDRVKPSDPDIRLVLRHGDRLAEVRIENADNDAVQASLQAALPHVHPEQ